MSPRLWSVLLSLTCTSVVLAQTSAPERKTTVVSGAITPRQGHAIVTAARTRERQGGPSPDCSHLVHEVYAIAGLRYPYTDSFDLYAGAENFVRVTSPQPGDLVVWPGHVGIVVDPADHSFYSSLRSGPGTEFYDAPYWKARGPARFYRYVQTAPPKVTLAQQRGSRTRTEPAQLTSVPEDSPESTSTEPTKSDNATVGEAADDSPSIHGPVETPSSILVATARNLPNLEDVAEAVSELNNAAANALREQNLGEFTRKVVIYDKLTVQHVDAKGGRGSAKIRIDSLVALTGQRIEHNRRHEEVRSKLVRTTQGWELLAQPDSVYVPRDVAVHQLATRLALLTQDTGATQTSLNRSEQIQILRLLSILVQGM